MARAVPYSYREKIIQYRESGKKLREIVELIPYSEGSIKRILSRYKKEGKAGLQTRYQNCGIKSPYDIEIRNRVKSVKDGDQGAGYVRSKLLEQYPEHKIPSERTIQNWWKTAGSHRPKGRPKNRSKWTDEPNHTWQIDGKGYLTLKTGEQISWMKVADEATNSDLGTRLFPPDPSRSD